MNTAALIALAVGTAALLFGAWGRFSDVGKARFDEMAGMIPFAAWYAGMGLIALSVCLWIAIWLRR